MNKEQVLLNELNALGNFDTVQQEFNELQLEAIYNSMDAVQKYSDIHNVSTSEIEKYAVFCIELDRQGMNPVTYPDYLKIG